MPFSVKGYGQAWGKGANFPSGRFRVITASMTDQDTVITKKRKGPAPTGKGVLVGVRLQPDDLAALDAWIDAQDDKPSRPEAVRKLMRLGMLAQRA